MTNDELRTLLDAFDDLIIANGRLRNLLPAEEAEKLLSIQTQVIDLYLPWMRRWRQWNETPDEKDKKDPALVAARAACKKAGIPSHYWPETVDVEGREDLGAMDAREAAYERDCRLADKDTV